MAVPMISELRPANGLRFALLEDVYLRGGYRSVATYSELQTLDKSTLKVFMLVAVVNQRKVYWLDTDLTTWHVGFVFNQDGTLTISGSGTGGGTQPGTVNNLFEFNGAFVTGRQYKRSALVFYPDPSDPTRTILYAALSDIANAMNPPHLDPTNWFPLGDKITYVKGEKGDKGEDGKKGTDGKNGDPGPQGKGMRYRGVYAPTEVYNALDVVRGAGSDPSKVTLFTCKVDNTSGLEPVNNPAKWDMVFEVISNASVEADIIASFKDYSQRLADEQGQGLIADIHAVTVA